MSVNTIQAIFDVSDEITKAGVKRHPAAILTKATEELGELATEVGIVHMGFYKEPGKDGILGEACDLINCAVDLIHISNPEATAEQVHAIIMNKLAKWKSKTVGQ